MDKVCVSCSRTGKALPISGCETVYICAECSKSFSNQEPTVTNYNYEDIDEDNNICSECLFNVPSYLRITDIPFKKFCYECCSKITKTGDRMFIKKKWQNFVRTPDELGKRDLVKEKINSLKVGFNKYLRQLDNAKETILSHKYQIQKQIDEFYKSKLLEISTYKENLQRLIKETLSATKLEIIKGTIHKSSSKINQLLKSEQFREDYFKTTIIQCSIKSEIIINQLNDLINISLKPITSLISSKCISLLHPKVNSIFEIHVDLGIYNEYTLDSVKIPWKPLAAWCPIGNGSILYTGGEDSSKTSSEVILIDYHKSISYLSPCIPKKNHFLLYHHGVVYSFGGYNDLNERYIPFLNIWEQISPSPESFGQCSAASLNGMILIAGYKRKDLYLYDPDKNLYKKIPGFKGFNTNASKLIIVRKGKVFILQRDKIFDTNADLKVWGERKIEGAKDLEWYCACSVLDSDSLSYVLLNDFRLFGVDCEVPRAKQIEFKKVE